MRIGGLPAADAAVAVRVVIASSHGKASVAPRPRSIVRREIGKREVVMVFPRWSANSVCLLLRRVASTIPKRHTTYNLGDQRLRTILGFLHLLHNLIDCALVLDRQAAP